MQPAKSTKGPLLDLLHVGCGQKRPERLPACFRTPAWNEIRFDIDSAVEPDIIGSITDLSLIGDATMDAIWSSHNLEHLNSFEVPLALAEFRRVLKPNGFALISVPDLRAVARHIVTGQLDKPLYHSAAGPITAIDIVYGHQLSLQHGNDFMGHRTGFTADSLGQALCESGFPEVRVHTGSNWDLWAVALMPETSEEVFQHLSGVMQ
ncbi:class I SAM-dependent methyltransferase [Pseudoduganella rivuli]|uniref:class I SAM-dependent methyltransferase n=1 Tax=Pseudoduganella rivuli TaxID=2666085 RepID=UPI003530C898